MKNMKKEMNKIKILSLLIIGLFLVSFFIGIVNAATSAVDTAQQKVGILKTLWDTFFAGIFSGWTDVSFSIGTYNVQISQFLLGFIVFLLVFSISGFIPLLSEGDWKKWGFSIAVALLSFLFVDADTIKGILSTYEALGVVLTSVIPLIIIIVAMYKIRDDPKLGAIGGFVAKFILIGFFFWMILKWGASPGKYASFYLGTAIVALIWIFIEKKAWKWLKMKALKVASEKGEERGQQHQILKLNNKIEELQQAIAREANKDVRLNLQRELKIAKENRDIFLKE